MREISGGVTAAAGFTAAGINAGLRNTTKKDMALVYSEVPAVTAGVFTTNVVKAAPVKRDISLLSENDTTRAMVLNSGIANACTGAIGDENNQAMAQAVADACGIDVDMVMTASTGVIGMQLPMDPLKKGCAALYKALSDDVSGADDAAHAIMTTDTYDKQIAVEFELSGKTVHMGGMSKGSGMIHPNMATMLCVITTDVAITREMLEKALKENVRNSFNMISVDRDTSTNDTYVIMANGEAKNTVIEEDDADYKAFCEALQKVSVGLAKKMAADGEGATKLFEVNVIGASSEEQARVLAKSVITSNLVKTAIFGNDANWGRILCAMGYSGEQFDPDVVDLYITSEAGELKIVENGMATDYSEDEATKILSSSTVTATADMKLGSEMAIAWGCDLTYDYVKINGDYRS